MDRSSPPVTDRGAHGLSEVATGADAGPGRPGAAAFGFGVGLALYAGVGLALHLGLFTSLPRDELEAAYFAQGWAWRYDPDQPPLYNWLARLAVELTGSGGMRAALAGLKMALLTAAYAALHGTVRRLGGGSGAAVLAGMAPLATFALGYETLLLYTHSVLLLTAVALTLLALAGLDQAAGRPARAGWAALLGLALAAGLLTKPNFALFAFALAGAALLDRHLRRRLARPVTALALAPPLLALGLLVLGPAAPERPLGEALAVHLETAQAARPIEILSAGLLGPPALILPLPLVLAALAPAAARRLPDPASRFEHVGRRWLRLLERFWALAVGLAMAGALGLGAHRLDHHYLLPLMLAIPLYLALRVALSRPDPARRRRLRWALAALALAGPAMIAVETTLIRPATCQDCRLLVPAAGLAEELRAAGFTAGTVVASGLPWSAVLLPELPEARLVAAGWGGFRPPSAPPGRPGGCLLLLRPGEAEADRRRLESFLRQEWGVALPPGAALRAVRAPIRYAGDRRFTLPFILVPGGLGGCR